MKLTIHRGTKEIGGSCVEIASGKTRIIVDLGMPLVNAQNEHFDSRLLEGKSVPELIDSHILPGVSGLYGGEEKGIDAILLSHSHQDHYGLLQYINPEIPVYLTEGAQALINASDLFIPTKANLRNAKVFEKRKSFTIGGFNITPRLVDHSAFDAVAFLIEGDGKKIFYSGDFRAHGRKGILFKYMCSHPIRDIDYLLLEGSMLGRMEGPYPNEKAVEDKLKSAFQNKSNIAFVFCSSQNIDRLVSIYRAAKRTGQTFVIDLYTAYILNSLRGISHRLPQYFWLDVRVVYFKYHADTLANNGMRDFLYRCSRSKIEKADINRYRKNIVMVTRNNHDFWDLLNYVDDFTGTQAIYSMWEGYLENSGLRDKLTQKGIALEIIHTSGHATENDLEKLVDSFKPGCLFPIHTFQPERYPSLFAGTPVRLLKDGEEIIL